MKLTINVTVVSKKDAFLRYMLEVRDESGTVIVNATITNHDAERLIEQGVSILYLNWE